MSRKAQQKILDALARAPGLSDVEIAAVTGMTVSAVGHHLVSLRARGQVPAATPLPDPEATTTEELFPPGAAVEFVSAEELAARYPADPEPAVDPTPGPVKETELEEPAAEEPVTWVAPSPAPEPEIRTSGYMQADEPAATPTPRPDEHKMNIAQDKLQQSIEGLAQKHDITPTDLRESLLSCDRAYVKEWAARTSNKLGISLDDLRAMPCGVEGLTLGQLAGKHARGEAPGV